MKEIIKIRIKDDLIDKKLIKLDINRDLIIHLIDKITVYENRFLFKLKMQNNNDTENPILLTSLIFMSFK